MRRRMLSTVTQDPGGLLHSTTTTGMPLIKKTRSGMMKRLAMPPGQSTRN